MAQNFILKMTTLAKAFRSIPGQKALYPLFRGHRQLFASTVIRQEPLKGVPLAAGPSLTPETMFYVRKTRRCSKS